jgi:hypothetical protein
MQMHLQWMHTKKRHGAAPKTATGTREKGTDLGDDGDYSTV